MVDNFYYAASPPGKGKASYVKHHTFPTQNQTTLTVLATVTSSNGLGPDTVFNQWFGQLADQISALKDLTTDLKHLIHQPNPPTQISQFAILVSSGNQAFMVSQSCFVGLLRGESLGQLLGPNQTTTLIGPAKPGDSFILTTQDFLNKHTLKIKDLVSQSASSQETISDWARLLVSDPSPSLAVALTTIPKPTKPSLFQKLSKLIKPKPTIHINKPKTTTNRKKILVLLAMLALSLLAARFWQTRNQQAQELLAITGPAQELLAQAENQAPVNRLAARKNTSNAISLLEASLPNFPEKSKPHQTLQTLLTKAQELHKQVSGVSQTELQTHVDFSWVSETFFGDKMFLLEDNIVVLDSNNELLMQVGVLGQNQQLLSVPEETGDLTHAAPASSGYYLASTNGIFIVDQSGVEKLIDQDEDWQDPAGLEGFSDNLYLLDRANSDLWRYRPSRDTLLRERWLAPGVNPDFSDVIDFMIDGDIWVLNSTGSLRKYARGVGEQIEFAGLEQSITSANLVYSSENIYLYDQNQSRVLIFDPTGLYQKQLNFQSQNLITDMIVVENQIFLLSGQILYKIDL